MEARTARKTASSLFVASLVLLLLGIYVALVFYENTVDAGAEFFAAMPLLYWIIILGTLLVLILVVLIILYGAVPARAQTAGSTGGRMVPVVGGKAVPAGPAQQENADEWSAVPAEEEWTPAPSEPPLVVAEPEPAPPPVVAEPAPVFEQVAEPAKAEPVVEELPPPGPLDEALVVRCLKCNHEFELPFTEERDIRTKCPECGSDALLEEGLEVLSPSGMRVLDLEGIGPEFEAKLKEAGIDTSEQLRHASTHRLHVQTGIPMAMIEFWKSMSDLVRVKGIGKQFSELLVRSGVRSVKQLAAMKPQELVDRIAAYLSGLKRAPTKAGVSRARASRLIRAARALKK